MGTASYVTMNKWGRKWSMAICLSVAGVACIADGAIAQFVPDKSVTAGVEVVIFMIGKLGITAAFGTIYLYTSELLPTSCRTAALGISSMCGRVGSIMSPYIGSLQDSVGPFGPMMIFGV